MNLEPLLQTPIRRQLGIQYPIFSFRLPIDVIPASLAD
jgi:hypothetical protein